MKSYQTPDIQLLQYSFERIIATSPLPDLEDPTVGNPTQGSSMNQSAGSGIWD